MNEFTTDKASYTAEDFRIWEANGVLDVTPKFQRRSVWRTKNRSFFIDTLLRGMTVPPLYLRLTQNNKTTKTVREVVDGQQRIRCVLEFIVDDGYRLSKSLKAEWKGKRFDELSDEQQKQILDFSFSTETFKGISDQQVFEVFGRLNTNGVPLNKQELRHGKYFGLFKQTSWDLALAYLEFWRTERVFSEISIARMLEVELTSELLIAGSSGMQDKKTSISDYYEKWEDDYPDQRRDEKRFNEVMSTIVETFKGGALADTEFHRPPMFYTLYCVIYHHLYGLPDIARHSPKKRLGSDEIESLSDAVSNLSEIMVQSKDKAFKIPDKYVNFIGATSRHTDNIGPRKERFNTLFGAAF
jgi:hypothetical protein